ncbi:5-carboxymethyl-2-hydroxymuconate semialdehyde dehydrogenase [Actinokineospora enzanensis]|uniref:5-carboxymethyl-2-hydroxymuconate semialdehyde dehydrogenase n=1 Tax=Actinokineospora enzanensis TaxID=155975 RepID=UPI00035EAFFA|nr:5-carboxymethyl-2-hydroxymuconate semialdehyde dehydrogenase [Actinokineospora enzanensis]
MTIDVPRPADLPSDLRHFIDGKPASSVDGATFPVADPVTNEVYGRVAAGDAADIDLAVAAAKRAFTDGPWPRLSARERAKILNKIADGIEVRAERLAELETFDTGLPITQARGQAHRAAENFRYFADVIVAIHEESYIVGDAQVNYSIRQPAGVAGLITPWNTPFMLETWKLAPSLASGCTVVLKPAEWSPLSASLLPEIMTEAGVPDGVFNLVHGIGEQAGAALVAHPDVPRISFTGESGTGQIIMRTSADNLKEVSMELGGKSPCVVFADADFDRAVDSAVFGVFSLNGERCTASSRVLVQREIYDRFVEALAARANAVKVGMPADPTTEVGALIHPEHYERVMEYVEIGKRESRLVAGGARPEGLSTGNFLQPTVFADVRSDARIFQEEIFGPVVGVTPFDTEEEAIELANATKYGLAGYVWTSDIKRGHRVARAVQSGMVWINSHNVRDLRTPFGGIKASGVGQEGGVHSIDFYSDVRAIHVAVGDLHVPQFGKSGK